VACWAELFTSGRASERRHRGEGKGGSILADEPQNRSGGRTAFPRMRGIMLRRATPPGGGQNRNASSRVSLRGEGKTPLESRDSKSENGGHHTDPRMLTTPHFPAFSPCGFKRTLGLVPRGCRGAGGSSPNRPLALGRLSRELASDVHQHQLSAEECLPAIP
jgi:hypothetical protein